MKLDSSRPELLSTTLGTLLLALPLGILSPLSLSSARNLLSGSGLSMLVSVPVLGFLSLLCAAALLYGLVLGFFRHHSVSPLLFSFLGITALTIGIYLSHSQALTIIGTLCLLVAGTKNLLQQSSGLTDEPTPPPNLEAFLDRSA